MNEAYGKIRYLLGIDGGGTKTEFLLTDINGNEIKRIFLGASNPVNIGIENTKTILSTGINRICENINPAEISVFAGIAGSGSADIRASIADYLSSFGFGASGNGSDIDIALRAALNGENGVAVIMGTGIIAFTSFNGEMHRTGGWGYLIDKGGSGFCFGSDALNSAFKALDGRDGSETLLKLAEKRLGKPLAQSVADIYGGGASYIASFAPDVFEAYKSGDKHAEKIIDRNAKVAAEIIRTGFEFLKGEAGRVVVCGGLCRQQDILRPFLLKYLGNDFSLEFSDISNVCGAVSLAESLRSEKTC